MFYSDHSTVTSDIIFKINSDLLLWNNPTGDPLLNILNNKKEEERNGPWTQHHDQFFTANKGLEMRRFKSTCVKHEWIIVSTTWG